MAMSRFTHHGDARIHYLDSGGGERGAPIVFVPGMTDLADDYTEMLTLFGRRTVVVEVRGHGRSSSPASGYDLATLSRDVGAVVDAVTDGPVHVVTFSRGTSCAVAWALAQLGFPLLVVRCGESVLVGDEQWARYRRLFPHAELVEFHDSPHDIFRPDRGRYPRLVQQHTDRADGIR
jgi:pimeloyl-ACP methyl ester carboxylesterase